MAERIVSWKAIADFAAVAREAKKAEAALDSLKRKEREFNATQGSSTPTGDRSTVIKKEASATKEAAAASTILAHVKQQEATSTIAATKATTNNTTAQQAQVKALREAEAASKGSAAGFDALARTAERFSKTGVGRNAALVEAARATRTLKEESSKASVEMERTATSAGRMRRETDHIGPSMSAGSGGIDRFRRALAALSPEFDKTGRGGIRFGALLRGLAIPLVVTGINLLISALSPLTAGFMGLAGAIAPTIGLLGTLPGLLAAVAGGAGTLVAGFAGIGGALKAYSTQQKNSTKESARAVKAQRTQAKSQRAVGDAVRAAKEQAISSARAIRGAEQGLADAHRRAADAQRAVSQARKDARKEIDDLKKSLKDLALEEEGASLSLEEARARMENVNNDPGSTDLERRQAEYAVREAEARLKDVRDSQVENGKKLRAEQKKGIEGSDQVVAAKRAEADANRGVRDAELALSDARRQARNSARDSARAIKDASQNQKDAAASAAAAAKQQDVFGAAMKKLTPEAQAVVYQLIRMKKNLDELRATAQRGMMPGVLSFLQDLVKIFPLLNVFVGFVSRSFGKFFKRVGDAMSSKKAINDWGIVLDNTRRVIDVWLDSAFNVIVVLARILKAAGPLTLWLSKSVRSWTRNWKAMTSGERGQKRLVDFFKRAKESAKLLGSILGNVIGTLYNVGKSAYGLGNDMLKSFKRITQGWQDFTGSVKGQNAIKEWADKSRPALKAIGDLIRDFVIGIRDLGAKTDIAALLDQIRTQLLPALLKVFGLFTGETASHIVSILSGIGEMIATIAGSGAGGLDTFVAGLDAIVTRLDWLVKNVPGLSTILAALFTAMAAAAVINIAARLLQFQRAIKIVKSLKKYRNELSEGKFASEAKRGAKTEGGSVSRSSKKAGDTGKLAKRAAPKGAPKGGGKAIEEVGEGAAKAAPKLGKFLGVLGSIGPILAQVLPKLGVVGLLIGAAIVSIGITLGGLIVEVNQFKKYFPNAFQEIKGVLSGIWSGIVAIFQGAVRGISYYMKVMGLVIKLALQIVLTFLRIGWEIFTQLLLAPIRAAYGLVVEKLKKFGKAFVQFVKDMIGYYKRDWAAFKETFIKPVRDAFAFVKFLLALMWARFVKFAKPLIDYLRPIFKTIYEILAAPLRQAKDKVSELLAKVRDYFEKFVGGVKKSLAPLGKIVKDAFDKIKKAAADPIKFVIDAVNGGVIRPYLKLAKTFGIKTEVQEITYSLPKFQKGGKIPGRESNKRDNVLGVTSKGVPIARVEPGEFIMPRNKKKYFPLLEKIRRGDDSELRGYRNGGLLQRLFKGGITEAPPKLAPGHHAPAGLDLLSNKGMWPVGPKGNTVGEVDQQAPRGSAVPLAMPSKIKGLPVELQQLIASGPGIRDKSGLGALAGGGSSGSRAAGRGLSMVGQMGWYRRCLAFVNKAWNYAVGRFRLGTARQSMNAGGRTQGGRPPAGAGVYWDTGSAGHIALAVGDGTVVSNDIIKAGKLSRVRQGVINKWGPYRGWWSPNGAKGGAGGIPSGGGSAGGPGISLPNPSKLLRAAYDKAMAGASKFADSPFGKMVLQVPKELISGAVAKAKAAFKGLLGSMGGSSSGGDIDGSGLTGSNRAIGRAMMLRAGWGSSQWGPLNNLWTRESGWRTTAKNPSSGAYGIPQSLPGSKMASAGGDWRTNPRTQIKWGLGYIRSRYGSPAGAWAHSQRTNWYAKGTLNAKRGWAVVGENGPEIVNFKGGEVVRNQNQNLPGYNTGGVVAGMKPGAKGDWVRAINSEMGRGTGNTWTSALTSALSNHGMDFVGGYNAMKLTADMIKKVRDYIKKQSKNYSITDLGAKTKLDPTLIWKAASQIDDGLSKSKKSKFSKSVKSFGSSRGKWVKALEQKMKISGANGTWGAEDDEPLFHVIKHALGQPHDAYLAHPWQAYTQAETRVREQRRTNSLNTEFDGLVTYFTEKTFLNIVRKLNELGVADGLTLGRALKKDPENQVKDYDTALGEQYARDDAANGTSGGGDDKPAKMRLMISTIGSSTTANPLGLQSLAQTLGLSLDSTAGIFDAVTAANMWPTDDISTAKRARLEKDVEDFKKLFRFATGGVTPGSGNQDSVHALLTPGEMVLRKAATQEIQRRFGPGALNYLNNIDRFASGGMAGYTANGINTPGITIPSMRFNTSNSKATSGDTRTVTNVFNTNVYNPTLEDGAISVQKRVTRIARLGYLAGQD